MSIASNLLLTQVINNSFDDTDGFYDLDDNDSTFSNFTKPASSPSYSRPAPFAKFHQYYEFYKLDQIAIYQAQKGKKDFDPFEKSNKLKF